MPSLSTRQNGRIRCPGHDYRSRCIYHIVLNKAPGIPDFSTVIGIPGDRDWRPRTELTPIGKAVAAAISGLKTEFPFTSVLRRCIMPDHVHIAFYVRQASDTHLGIMIKAIKNNARINLNMQDSIFEEGYYDKILTKQGQLDRMLAYISDNPRRHLIRTQNPGYFHRFWITDGNILYEAYGNWDLLDEELIEAVKVSRSYTPEQLIEKKRLWLRTIRNDGVLVSPYIHPDEKKVRDWSIDNGGAIIQLTNQTLPAKYKPSGALFDACAEGRLLVVSVPERNGAMLHPDPFKLQTDPFKLQTDPFKLQTDPFKLQTDPFKLQTDPFKHEKPSREHCLYMNSVAERIAAGHFTVLK